MRRHEPVPPPGQLARRRQLEWPLVVVVVVGRPPPTLVSQACLVLVALYGAVVVSHWLGPVDTANGTDCLYLFRV